MDVRDIDQRILAARARMADATGPARAMLGVDLAKLLSLRYETHVDERAKRTDLDEIVELVEQADRLLPPADPLRPLVDHTAGRVYLARHLVHGSGPADRDAAIKSFTRSLAEPRLDRGLAEVGRLGTAMLLLARAMPGLGANLGGAIDVAGLLREFQVFQGSAQARADVDAAIGHLQYLVDHGAQSEQVRCMVPALLATATMLRTWIGMGSGTGGVTDMMKLFQNLGQPGSNLGQPGSVGFPGAGFPAAGFPGAGLAGAGALSGGFPGGGFAGGGFAGGAESPSRGGAGLPGGVGMPEGVRYPGTVAATGAPPIDGSWVTGLSDALATMPGSIAEDPPDTGGPGADPPRGAGRTPQAATDSAAGSALAATDSAAGSALAASDSEWSEPGGARAVARRRRPVRDAAQNLAVGRLDEALAAIESEQATGLRAATDHDAVAPISPPADARAIGAALRGVGAAVLAYLVVGRPGTVGRLLLVTASGALRTVPLPLLVDGAQSPFRALREGAGRITDDLCDWAWEAAIGPLWTALADEAGRRPRVVLVPLGSARAVPWHAARRHEGGRARYAIEDLAICFVPSGGLLSAVARRPALPLDKEVVFVADPSGTYPEATVETLALRRVLHPRAVGLGATGEAPSDPATPQRVLRFLPGRYTDGASLIHLAVRREPDPNDRLLLDGGDLSVGAILRHAAGRPAQSPGGVGVLSTSGPGASVGTLPAALLTAGMTGVVDRAWPTDERFGPLVAYMLHWFMATSSLSPHAALRATQLWLLDPDRHVPEEFPALLGGVLANPELRRASTWGAYRYQGR